MVKIISDSQILDDKSLTFVDMHHHSTASDGLSSPQLIAKVFAKRGLGVCICDHNQIKGSVYLAKRKDVFSIPSIEVTSKETKDIVAYFYDVSDLKDFWEREIRGNIRNNRGFNLNRTTLSVYDLPGMIKGYNGVPVLAHPFTFKPKDSRHLLRDKAFMRRVDAVELFDCGYATERQMGVIAGTGKPLTAGTDSHTISSFNALTGAKADGIDSFLSGILKKRNIIYYRKPSHLSRLAHACTVFRKNLSVKRRS